MVQLMKVLLKFSLTGWSVCNVPIVDQETILKQLLSSHPAEYLLNEMFCYCDFRYILAEFSSNSL